VSIDTHLHRMLQQLKWVKNSKNPEDTRIQLER
jgi:endonuclease III